MKAKRTVIDRDTVFKDLLGQLGKDPPVPEVSTSALRLERIDFNLEQPRRYHDPEAHQGLIDSVRKHGVIQPIIVRGRGERYEVVAGERRTRAALAAGLVDIPAVVLDVSDLEALEISTLENLSREDLNPLEETEAVLRLLEKRLEVPRDRVVWLLRQFDNEARGRSANSRIGNRERETIEAVFKSVGRFSPQSFVTNRLPLLNLPEDLQATIMTGKLSFTIAKLLASVIDPKRRAELMKQIVKNNLSKTEATKLIQESKPSASKPVSPMVGVSERLSRVQRLVRSSQPDRVKKVEALLIQIESILAQK